MLRNEPIHLNKGPWISPFFLPPFHRYRYSLSFVSHKRFGLCMSHTLDFHRLSCLCFGRRTVQALGTRALYFHKKGRNLELWGELPTGYLEVHWESLHPQHHYNHSSSSSITKITRHPQTSLQSLIILHIKTYKHNNKNMLRFIRIIFIIITFGLFLRKL